MPSLGQRNDAVHQAPGLPGLPGFAMTPQDPSRPYSGMMGSLEQPLDTVDADGPARTPKEAGRVPVFPPKRVNLVPRGDRRAPPFRQSSLSILNR
jgi:hypothetical protein